MRSKFTAMTVVLAACAVSNAANILTISGPSPFGFFNPQVLVEGWTQTGTFTNVSITMPFEDNSLSGPISGVEGTVYLMNQVGPTATPANELAPPESVSGLTGSFSTVSLFSGLTLGPGTYYVVLFSTNGSPLSMSPEGSSTPVVTAASGVTALPDGLAFTTALFPPASNMSFNPPSSPGNMFINVTGDSSTVPEPGAAWFFGLGLVALVLRRRAVGP